MNRGVGGILDGSGRRRRISLEAPYWQQWMRICGFQQRRRLSFLVNDGCGWIVVDCGLYPVATRGINPSKDNAFEASERSQRGQGENGMDRGPRGGGIPKSPRSRFALSKAEGMRSRWSGCWKCCPETV